MPDISTYQTVITLSQWIDAGLTYYQYEHDKQRYFLRSSRPSNGNEVQIEWDSILEKRKVVLRAKYGDPTPKGPHIFTDIVQPDPEAYTFFSNYKLTDGRSLPLDAINEYCANAAVLNAVGKVASDSIQMRRNMGNAVQVNEVWNSIAKAVLNINRDTWAHTLPGNSRRLRDKNRQYLKESYQCLVHRNFCNQSARKVSPHMEDLFLSLYTTLNRHFAKSVRDIYLQFLSGSIELASITTGELFNRADFFDNKGEPLGISESTTWSYLAKPGSQQAIRKFRDSSIDFKTKSLAFNHRHKPNYTLSKISFDDRDLPRKTASGFEVKAYYAYEPLSGCWIGWAYSREKNIPLIMECFKNMLSFCQKHNLPWPGEAEVERHLMTQLKEPLEQMFAHVRWCNPGNSREKRAEHGIKIRKYGAEKLYQENIGRWRNRGDAYKINEDNNKVYEYDDLVADDIFISNSINMQIHPAFPDKTRLQVLRELVNPQLGSPVLRIILKHIGNRTETSVRNFDFVRVNYKDYRIDSDKVLAMLSPNNYDVEAYWLPDENGEVKDVYLYQGEKYLCQAQQIETYNEAFVERTDRDEEIRIEQAKHAAHVRKRVEDRAKTIPRIEVIRNMPDFSDVEPEILDVSPASTPDTYEQDNITADSDYWKELGMQSI